MEPSVGPDHDPPAWPPPEKMTVSLPSGQVHVCASAEEAGYLVELAELYQGHHQFSDVADLTELDRLLVLEARVWRWSQDTGEPDTEQRLLEYSAEVREIKRGLGIDTAARATAHVGVPPSMVAVDDGEVWAEPFTDGARLFMQADAAGNYLSHLLTREDCAALGGFLTRCAEG